METNDFIETLNALVDEGRHERIEVLCDDCIHAEVCWKAYTDIAGKRCSDFRERGMKVRDFKRYFYGSDILVATEQGYVYLSEADENLLDTKVEEVRASNSVIIV